MLFLLLRLSLECLEPLVPELVEKRLQLRKPFRPGLVEAPRAAAPLAHETRLPEDVEVLGHRRPRDVEVRRDLPRRELPGSHEGEDPAPPRRGDRLERSLHGVLCKQVREVSLDNTYAMTYHTCCECQGQK